MRQRFYSVLISLAAVGASALAFSGPAEAAAARCDGHHQCQHKAAGRKRQRARAARQRARTRRRDQRRTVAYVCPMHPDIRERARGTCPKCLMDLVAEPQGAKQSGTEEGARSAGAASTGGR